MTAVLEKLFDKYNLEDKDRYEIQQIYSFLSPQKKIRMVENFGNVVKHIEQLKKEMFDEQQILFDNTLKNVQQKIKQAEERRVRHSTETEITKLRNFILG